MAFAAVAERVTANGKVVGDHGKPLEHATVLVYEARTRHGYSAYCPTCWVDCGKRTITDAEGKYSIAGLSSDLVFKLLVVRSGYKPVFVDKVDPVKGPAADAVLKPRTVAADPSQIVRGRIVDEHGKPVRDVAVEQREDSARTFGPDDSPDWIQPLAATNEQGGI